MTDPEIPGVHFLPIRDPAPDEKAFSAAERQALDQVNRRIAGAADLEAAVSLLAAAMWPVAPCDRFGLAFNDEENGRQVSRVSHAEYAPVLLTPGYSESLHGSSLERVISGHFLRIIDDLVDYIEHFSPNVRDVFDGFGLIDEIAPASTDRETPVWPGLAETHLLEAAARIDRQCDTSDVAGFVGREEQHRIADVLWLHPRDW
jgi:hypothetical protein